MRDHRLTITATRRLTPRYFVLDFEAPELAGAARAGQFVMVSVGEAIDPLLRRPMAVYQVLRDAGAPAGVSLLIEEHGRGTRLLAAARPGQQLSMLGPLGRPFRQSARDIEHLLVMGGVGAAPFPMFAQELCDSGRRVRAFIGGQSQHEVLCRDDFERLGVPVHVATDDGSMGFEGFVTGALDRYLDETPDPAAVYSCGPTPMLRAVDRIARDRRLRHQVSLEAPMACGIGVCLSCVVRVGDEGDWHYERICREGPVFDAERLLWEAAP